jgi:predicted DNA-binding mobile mystery protein A
MIPIGYYFAVLMLLIGNMKKQFRDLQLQQMDATLAAWKLVPLAPRPGSGWVRAIRDALGMTAAALSRRLGMTHAGLRKLETAEASDVITLASLRKLAQALDCELHYALVPRTSLTQQLQDRAQTLATEKLRPISHSMALEDQAVTGPYDKLQIDAAAKALLEGSRRELW